MLLLSISHVCVCLQGGSDALDLPAESSGLNEFISHLNTFLISFSDSGSHASSQLADIHTSMSSFDAAQSCVEAGILAAVEARLLEQQVCIG